MVTPSKSSSGAAASTQILQTPVAKAMSPEEALFAGYGLSPPPESKEGGKTFEESTKKIKKEMKNQWNRGSAEDKRIILFLFSRNFHGNSPKPTRLSRIMKLLQGGKIRDRMLQILKEEGDNDLSKEAQRHYIASCLVIVQYFRQEGAKGFVTDMSSITYYLRQQKYGSCFLQASCVFISYLVQAHDRKMPPPDGSKLVRHSFSDDQLLKYVVEDTGGDSIAVCRLLEKHFFDCDDAQRAHTSFECHALRSKEGRARWARTVLSEVPGLVAKFRVPSNFRVNREGSKKPGYARFTEWGEAAEFIECQPRSDEEKLQLRELAKMWKQSCQEPQPSSSFDSFGELTAATVSASQSLDDDEGEGYLGTDIEDLQDYCEDLDVTLSDNGCDDSEAKSETNEGDSDLHAMILLGSRLVGGEICWVFQNSWSGMRVIEMSTDYLASSGGVLVFFDSGRTLKDEPSPLIQLCSSPVAESASLDRADCETWDEVLTMGEDACLEMAE